MTSTAFLQRITIRPEKVSNWNLFPFNLPFVRELDVAFTSPVTFLVGENGSGKSTLVEAIAQLCRLPVAGGGRNELPDVHGPHLASELAPALRAAFRCQPPGGYFFRAEFQAHFASLLEARRRDPDFMISGRDPYERFGGRSLHTRSHGEAFLEMFATWLHPGFLLMDEPESALSPQRQLTLLLRMKQLVENGKVQLVIATHSPIILTFPGAQILSLDSGRIEPVRIEETSHFQITKGLLDAPDRYWHHLLAPQESTDVDE
jgi:predicted ATPase